jgi:hypothetical protein
MSEPQLDSNETARKLAMGFAAEIPEVGGGVSLLLDLFWPDNLPSIWDSIKAQVSNLIDQRILAAKIETIQEDIDDLRNALNEYSTSKPPEQGTNLAIALGKADNIYAHVTEPTNAFHLLPLAVALSHVHLVLLAERERHGVEVFGAGQQQDPEWAAKLTKRRLAYRAHFRSQYQAWAAWRGSQITCDTFVRVENREWRAHGWVKDALAGSNVDYEASAADEEQNVLREAVGATMSLYWNRARAGMAAVLAPTFLLNRYDPATADDPPDVDPALAYLTLGPYCAATLGQNGLGPVRPDVRDVPGAVTGLSIRLFEGIQSVELKFSDHEGAAVPLRVPAAPQSVAIPDGEHCVGLKGTFTAGLLASVAVHFSGGSHAGPFGRVGTDGDLMDAFVGPAYALYGSEIAIGDAPGLVGVSQGVSLLTLKFAHASLINPGIKSHIATGEYLSVWQSLVSVDGTYRCVMQGDGNLCIYKGEGGPLTWQSASPGPIGAYFAVMQQDGNLCVYAGDRPPPQSGPAWQSGSATAQGDYFAALDESGKLQIFSGTTAAPGRPIWNSA